MRLLTEDQHVLTQALEALQRDVNAAVNWSDLDAMREALNAAWGKTSRIIRLANEAEERARKNALEGVE